VIQGNEQNQRIDRRLAWYQEARFGLFIHWGPYSIAGVEASWPIMTPVLSAAMFGTELSINEEEYIKLPAQFNPVDFDPDEWVHLAKETGMRYIIFTSKHHDGFCMFDAPGTDYKITNAPYGKDICLELSQACARAGMPLGFYYSPPDMHHPGYRDTSQPVTKNWTGEPKRDGWGEYLDYMESHIRKLLTDYGEISVIWFDGLSNHGKYDPERFHQLIHELSPKTLINDRFGEDYDFTTPEQFVPLGGIPAKTGKPNPGMDTAGDGFFALVTKLATVPLISGLLRNYVAKHGVIELTKVHQEPFPSPDRFQPWETCMTMGGSWAYNPKEKNWKPHGKLIRNLVDVASHGGNYLLNVGPTDTGTFPSEAVERMKHIGRWMKTNQTAIYGSTYTPMKDQEWGRATRKDDQIYLHIYNWPEAGPLLLDDFPGKALAVNRLDGKALTFNQTGKKLEISLPTEPLDQDVSVLMVKIDPHDPVWDQHSAPVVTTTAPGKYIKDQAFASFIINAILNGLIALFSYRLRDFIPFPELAVDILITVFIITFFTSWIVVGGARGEYRKGNITKGKATWRRLKLPNSSIFRALLISLVLVVLFGGVFLDGLINLISPAGVSNWMYILIKTLYTGASGALASVLTILSIVNEENRS